MTTTKQLLARTYDLATTYLDGVRERRVGSLADYEALLGAMGGALPNAPADPLAIINELAATAERGLVATPGPRHFGFVLGGVLPAALAADWLASAWDQNAFSFVLSPAATVVEEVARQWLTELLGLSPEMSLGIVTGGTMGNFTGLAAGRHALLARAGWDVEEQGLFGAPELPVVTSEESHITIFASLQMLGMGRARVTRVAADEQGRMRADALRSVLSGLSSPALVCAQAGNVNSGAFDPIAEIAPIVHDAGGWLHVDGAFGAWAAASPRLKGLTAGLELADSVSVDAHKWLNVPYDCGFVFVRDVAAHRAAMTLEAPYYAPAPSVARANHNFVPEASRRARGFAVYAALRSLGRDGLAELVERCSRLAKRMAVRLAAEPGVRILNDVVLNQVLVRFDARDGLDEDATTAAVIRRVQQDGTCWVGGTTWKGMHVMRVSVSNWSTTEEDIDRSADAIVRAASAVAD
ncbi:MAG: PLP-dependent enzyme glutamate decarboxylase [Gemmatimonadetes bacterium]|nr:PLP-dependent enzyme glutamate decarboxylase [Gemmatimonadota bacterium]